MSFPVQCCGKLFSVQGFLYYLCYKQPFFCQRLFFFSLVMSQKESGIFKFLCPKRLVHSEKPEGAVLLSNDRCNVMRSDFFQGCVDIQHQSDLSHFHICSLKSDTYLIGGCASWKRMVRLESASALKKKSKIFTFQVCATCRDTLLSYSVLELKIRFNFRLCSLQHLFAFFDRVAQTVRTTAERIQSPPCQMTFPPLSHTSSEACWASRPRLFIPQHQGTV